jgi:ribosomal subunit interface protein
LDRAEVHFVEERNPRIAAREVCEVSVEGRGFVLHAKAAAADTFAAIDVVIEKLEHQLHSMKTKLVARKHGSRRDAAVVAAAPLDD